MIEEYKKILQMTPNQQIILERKLREDLGQIVISGAERKIRYKSVMLKNRQRGTSSTINTFSPKSGNQPNDCKKINKIEKSNK